MSNKNNNCMYSRELQNKLLELSEHWSIISVTGPRQSGKTTLCKMTFPDYEYVNLERATTRAIAGSVVFTKLSV